jgi:hypothetical protein
MTVNTAIVIKNFALNGSQRLAIDKRIKEAKLNGGPAIPGIIQPTIPMITQIMARIIKTIIAISLCYIAEKVFSQKKKQA